MSYTNGANNPQGADQRRHRPCGQRQRCACGGHRTEQHDATVRPEPDRGSQHQLVGRCGRRARQTAPIQWQWQSAALNINQAGSSTWSNIAGASNAGPTATALTIGTALAGLQLRAKLTYTDAKGTVETLFSDPSSPVSSGAGTPFNGTTGNDTLTGGNGADTLTGLAGNDRLNGGAGADSMIGSTGDDIYYIDHSGDTVTENAGEGNDTAVSWVSYTLPTNVEYLSLWGDQPIRGDGNALGNILYGNVNPAPNVLAGGTGNDTYIVGLGDTVVELPGEGTTDRIFAYVDYTLPDHVEQISLVGGAPALRATANELANTVTGNELANLLEGLAGNDTLTGGLGNDTLDGGQGTDRALYTDANGGTAAQYNIVFVGGSTYTVTKIATGEMDTLTDVELVQFTNTTVTLDTSGGVGQQGAIRRRQDDHHAGGHRLHDHRGRLRLLRRSRFATPHAAGSDDHFAARGGRPRAERRGDVAEPIDCRHRHHCGAAEVYARHRSQRRRIRQLELPRAG